MTEPSRRDSERLWPPIDYETFTWESRHSDRIAPDLRYQAAVPPFIASRSLVLDARTAALSNRAEHELVRFDARIGDELLNFAPLLLRSEAAASSQIENLTASARAILTAELGDTSKRNATEIVGNTRAMTSALELARALDAEAIKKMHVALMEGTNHTPGEWRTEPVWIGTSARSPSGAVFVAPGHDRIPPLIDDLMAFIARDDLPTLAQTAVAHAQFETIHPFTDGNGRTGRALVQSMLRSRGLTRSVIVPVSAGLLVDVEAYHQALTAYRGGEPGPIVEQFAEAAFDAIDNATTLLSRLRDIRAEWNERAQPRKASQLAGTLDLASREPVFTVTRLARHLGIAAPNAYPHVRRLVELGILKTKSEHTLGQVVRSDEVLDALDEFAARAGRRSRT